MYHEHLSPFQVRVSYLVPSTNLTASVMTIYMVYGHDHIVLEKFAVEKGTN